MSELSASPLDANRSLLPKKVRCHRIVTTLRVPASREQLWNSLLYFEQIEERPPLLLRLVLPTPLGVSGPKSQVGDESRCDYEQGQLHKKITSVIPQERLAFEVVQQSIPMGGLRLLGGCYQLSALPQGGTRISVETGYETSRQPRLFWAPLEAIVCHAFHRHLLGAMAKKAKAVAPLPSPRGS